MDIVNEMAEEEKRDRELLFRKLESSPLFASILLNVLESVRIYSDETTVYDTTVNICLTTLYEQLESMKNIGKAKQKQKSDEIKRLVLARKMEGTKFGGKTRKTYRR